jgi:galactonate dehydratase
MIHPDVAYSGGITGCKRIASYAAMTRIPMGLHSGPCSLIRFYASAHLAASVENFFKIENVRGFKEMAGMFQGKEPMVRNAVFPVPEGPGLGFVLNEDWLKKSLAPGEAWWGKS